MFSFVALYRKHLFKYTLLILCNITYHQHNNFENIIIVKSIILEREILERETFLGSGAPERATALLHDDEHVYRQPSSSENPPDVALYIMLY